MAVSHLHNGNPLLSSRTAIHRPHATPQEADTYRVPIDTRSTEMKNGVTLITGVERVTRSSAHDFIYGHLTYLSVC